MSQLTDAMNAALANLKSELTAGGLTADQVTAQIHTVVDPEIAALTASVSTITSSEADDATKIADLEAAVTAFTTAFAPAAPAQTPNAAPTNTPSATSPAAAGDAPTGNVTTGSTAS